MSPAGAQHRTGHQSSATAMRCTGCKNKREKINHRGPNSKQVMAGVSFQLQRKLVAPCPAGHLVPAGCPHSEPSTCTKAAKVTPVAQGWPGPHQAQANLSFHPRKALLKAPTWIFGISGSPAWLQGQQEAGMCWILHVGPQERSCAAPGAALPWQTPLCFFQAA